MTMLQFAAKLNIVYDSLKHLKMETEIFSFLIAITNF